MAEVPQPSSRPRRRLACGAVSCGGCVKECGVVVYKYLAGLDLTDYHEDPPIADPATASDPQLPIHQP